MRSNPLKMLALAVALLFLPVIADAQSQGTDPKWNAWLGCWELVLEDARDAATRPNPARRPLAQPRDERPQVCVEAAGNGATLTTRVANQSAIQQTIVADGVEHPITDGDCRGTQQAEWSKDGKRLYSRAELSCGNDKGNRRVSGFSILGANGTWTDIQAVDVSGQQTVRVRNYRRVNEATQIGTGLTRATPLTLEDVREAAPKVSERALEAALVETGSSFDLTGKDLLALKDGKVPPSITDLMIALSYPDRFVIERTARADRGPTTTLLDEPFFLGWAFGYPMWSDAFGFYSPYYGRYYSQFYSPFYSYLPWYDPGYFGGGSIIITDPGGGAGAPLQPSGAGRVVDGRGYTRVRPREAEPTTPRSSAGSLASSSGGSGSSGSAPSSGGGGGSVSSSGFSSGGSGGDGGRTAQPR
jgi:hypothetical protein